MKLKIQPLTRAAFAPYGDVIETDGAAHYPINEGTAERFHDLAEIDVESDGGRPLINIFVGRPRPKPVIVRMMERHPLGTQLFVPLQDMDYLIVVAAGEIPLPQTLRGFRAKGSQGVNYHRNIWHHPLLVLDQECRFLVVDRGGKGVNLEEAQLSEPVLLDLPNFADIGRPD
jgi:ureidoglycolate lyase